MLQGLREAALALRAFVCFVCLVGPVLTIVGVALLALAAYPDRENKIAEYNAAVEEWPAINVAFSSPSSTFELQSNALTMVDDEHDVLLDSDMTGISAPVFAPRYEISETATGGTTTWSIATGPTTDYSVTMLDNVAMTSTGPERSSGIPLDYTLTTSEPDCVLQSECEGSSCNICKDTECTANGGTYDYDARSCATTRYLQSVCFVVEDPQVGADYEYSIEGLADGESLDEHISIAPIYGSTSASGEFSYGEWSDAYFGCYYESANVYFREPPFYPGTYGATYKSSVDFQIRHKKDPYVVASRLTKGTYAFGLSVQQKMVAGFILLGTGLALTAIVCGLMRRCFGKATNKNGDKPVTVTSTAPTVMGTAQVPMMSPQQPQMMYGQPMQQPMMQQPQQMVYIQPMQQPQQMMYAQPMQQPMMQQPQQMVYAPPMPQQQQQQLPPQYMQPQAPGGGPQYYPPQQMQPSGEGFAAGTKF